MAEPRARQTTAAAPRPRRAATKTRSTRKGKAGLRTRTATGSSMRRGGGTRTAVAGKNLVIVESPAKARTVGRILGSHYDVRASVGHVRDLPKSTLGVDVEHDFAPKYIVPREKQQVVNELRDAAKGASKIYLATDPDREGEAIAR